MRPTAVRYYSILPLHPPCLVSTPFHSSEFSSPPPRRSFSSVPVCSSSSQLDLAPRLHMCGADRDFVETRNPTSADAQNAQSDSKLIKHDGDAQCSAVHTLRHHCRCTCAGVCPLYMCWRCGVSRRMVSRCLGCIPVDGRLTLTRPLWSAALVGRLGRRCAPPLPPTGGRRRPDDRRRGDDTTTTTPWHEPLHPLSSCSTCAAPRDTRCRHRCLAPLPLRPLPAVSPLAPCTASRAPPPART